MAEYKHDVDDNKPKASNFAIGLEAILGVFGFYGIGHLVSKKWLIGTGFLLFSFLWLFLEGITKDMFLGGSYPPGICALAFHLPIMLISISLLRRGSTPNIGCS